MPEKRYAGFWIRTLAHIVDHAVLSFVSIALCLVILVLVRRFQPELMERSFTDAFDPTTLQISLVVTYLFLAFPYYVVGAYTYGTSIGKSLVRASIVDAETEASLSRAQAVTRCLAYALSWPFCAGFLLAAFHPKKRALHDLLAGTVVVIRSRSFPGNPSGSLK